MIVEYIRYRVTEDRAEALVSAYRQAKQALQISPHCLGFELSRCTEEPQRYILRIEWDSTEGHLQGFRQSPEFRDFLTHVRPFIDAIEEMQHYALTDVRQTGKTIYDAAGGAETFFRVAKTMHSKMAKDAVLGARFSKAAESHVPHLAMWLCEVFGGPKLYSLTHGNIAPILKRHSNQSIAENERARFLEVASEAAKECFPTGSERALQAFIRYVDWGSKVAVDNSRPDHVANADAGVPTWDWDSR